MTQKSLIRKDQLELYDLLFGSTKAAKKKRYEERHGMISGTLEGTFIPAPTPLHSIYIPLGNGVLKLNEGDAGISVLMNQITQDRIDVTSMDSRGHFEYIPGPMVAYGRIPISISEDITYIQETLFGAEHSILLECSTGDKLLSMEGYLTEVSFVGSIALPDHMEFTFSIRESTIIPIN